MKPAWHDTPPVPGVYVVRDVDARRSPCGHGHFTVDAADDVTIRIPHYRWFGPIPRDPAAPKETP